MVYTRYSVPFSYKFPAISLREGKSVNSIAKEKRNTSRGSFESHARSVRIGDISSGIVANDGGVGRVKGRGRTCFN